jgi:hypothetical protein
VAWEELAAETTIDDFGAYLLANLARGIYNYEAVLREYVQNAGDAYLELPRMPKRPVITIRTVGNNSITVQDNGIGMDFDDLKECKKIAVSGKGRRHGRAGFRGIGIWAGFQSCNRLEIETTKRGSVDRYVLEIDFQDIHKHVHDNINVKMLLDGRVKIRRSSEEVSKDESYTIVKLIDLQNDYQKLLDEQELLRIASQTLPCKVDPTFEHHAALANFYQEMDGYQEYIIKVNNTEAYKHFPAGLQPPEFKTLEKDGIEYARVWRCTGDESVATQGFQDRNFRLRVLNIAVGRVGIYDDEDGSTFEDDRKIKSRAHLNWHVGEIHITHPEIRPDTPRSSLELDTLARQAIGQIRGFYEDSIMVSRARNQYLRDLKALEGAEEALEDPDSFTQERIAALIKNLEEQEEIVSERQTRDRMKLKLRQMLRAKALIGRRQSALEKLKAIPSRAAETSDKARTQSGTQTRGGSNGGGSSNGGKSRETGGRTSTSSTGAGQQGTTTKTSTTNSRAAAVDIVDSELLLSDALSAIEGVLGEEDDSCREVCEAVQAVFVQHGLINA